MTAFTVRLQCESERPLQRLLDTTRLNRTKLLNQLIYNADWLLWVASKPASSDAKTPIERGFQLGYAEAVRALLGLPSLAPHSRTNSRDSGHDEIDTAAHSDVS
jgi:hypothetical protein